MHDRDVTVTTTNFGRLLNYKIRCVRLDVVDGDESQRKSIRVTSVARGQVWECNRACICLH